MTEQEKQKAFKEGRRLILKEWGLTGFDSWPPAVYEAIRELEESLWPGSHVRKEDGRLY